MRLPSKLLFQVIDVESRKIIDGVSIQVQRSHDGTPACPSILTDASGNGINVSRTAWQHLSCAIITIRVRVHIYH
jgi:hypothetical protein